MSLNTTLVSRFSPKAFGPFIYSFCSPVPPSPPVTPEAYDKTKDSVSLKWKLPRHDGKGRIDQQEPPPPPPTGTYLTPAALQT